MTKQKKLKHEAERWASTLESVMIMEWFPTRLKFGTDKERAHKNRRDLISMCERVRILRVAIHALSPQMLIVPAGCEIGLQASSNGRFIYTPR